LIEEKGKVKDSEGSGLNFILLPCCSLPAEPEKYHEFIEFIGRPSRGLNTAHPGYETTFNALPLQ